MFSGLDFYSNGNIADYEVFSTNIEKDVRKHVEVMN